MMTVKNTNPRPNSIKGTLAHALSQAAEYGEFEFGLNTNELFSGDEFTLSVADHDKHRNRQAYTIGHIGDEDTTHVGFLNFLEPDASILEQIRESKRKDALDEIAQNHELTLQSRYSDRLDFPEIAVSKLKQMLEEAYEAGLTASK